ncbi:hypothetical protein HOH51_00565 [bacterium]|nr:hypothetical protein [bacterium]
MRIDCHFHPNFRFWLKNHAKQKSAQIFKKFTENKIDAVIVTEHAFKRPFQSFKKLKSFQPQSSKTLLIPGVEAVTKEGIDVIVFSASEYVYTQKEIMKTWCLSLKQLLKKIKQDPKLHAILPHPFLPTQQGAYKNLGKAEFQKILKEFKLFEAHNDCFSALQNALSKTKLEKIMPELTQTIKKVLNSKTKLPKSIKITGGSDAHHIGNIGSYLKLNALKPNDNLQAIKSLYTSTKRKMVFQKSNYNLAKDLSLNGMTAVCEFVQLYILRQKLDFKQSYHEHANSLHQGRRKFGKVNT